MGVVLLSTLIHAVLIAYGEWRDSNVHGGYTDVDYWVYSDAAAHVYNGRSAFDRHTYRYSPLLAWLLVPNEFLVGWWGKALFSLAGIISGVLIYKLTNRSVLYASLWLFSPLTLNISTRGSSDSLIILLILLVFYEMKAGKYNWAAIWFGLAVHLRIFPIFFLLPITLHLQSWKKAFQFAVISEGVCLGLIGLFYIQDGYRFLHEAYLYHFVRKDHRHNFSLFYYATYLASGVDPSSFLVKALTFAGFVPQLGSLVFVGFRYGRENFIFAIFLQTILFVAFNKVITAQYFLWFFGLVPVVLPMVVQSHKQVVPIVIVLLFWGLTEVAWLKASHRLESEGEHNFKELLAASTALFFAHIAICVVFIRALAHNRVTKREVKPATKATVKKPAKKPETAELVEAVRTARTTRRRNVE